MSETRRELVQLFKRFCPQEGFNLAPVPGVCCIKVSQPTQSHKQNWRAALAIFVQGGKAITLGRESHRCDDSHFIVTPFDLPVTSRISAATKDKPFLCLSISFDAAVLNEVATQIEADFPREMENPLRGLFIGKVTDSMLDAALRLARLFETPEDARVIAPLVMKEMLYRVLRGPDGPAIRQFVRSGSKMHKITEAIHSLRTELTGEVDVERLAKTARMSRSAFFKHFKEVTAMSPIQYQKKLRLLEARRLMTAEGETAEGSAFKVGYNSASQFSREYSRMFGASPVRDVAKIRKSGSAATTDG